MTFDGRKEGERMNEPKIPKTDEDIKEILCKQLALLAERSESCSNDEIGSLTESMISIVGHFESINQMDQFRSDLKRR